MAGKSTFLFLFALVVWSPLVLAQTGFTEVALAAGIQQKVSNPAEMGGGSAWLDYDRDGDEDLVLVGGVTGNLLYRNEGNGSFTDVTQSSGFFIPTGMNTQAVVTGDLDNDGFREILVTTWWHQPNFLFHNNGNGTFSDISAASGLGLDSLWTTTSAFADINLDGFLDLYTGNYVDTPIVTYDSTWQPIGYAHQCSANHLWLNNGNLTFTEVGAALSVADTGCALSVMLSDCDFDGDLDFWCANDFGEWVSPNTLFQNNYPNPAVEVSQSAGVQAEMYGMGLAAADYDHDLDLDVYVTNIGANRFFQSQGNGAFVDLAPALGLDNDSVNGALTTGWGTAFLDFDNDSWQDLFCANGHIQLIPIFSNAVLDPDQLWRNNGNGTFTEVGSVNGLADTWRGRGATVCDYDRDGDPDIWVSVISPDTANLPDRSLLFRNDLANGNHWVQFNLEGTRNNRDGIGARLLVSANGSKWLHEVQCGNSHYSQSSTIAHFGLGNATLVDTVTVIWPDGHAQQWTQLAGDSLHHLVEDSSQYLGLVHRRGPQLKVFPNPVTDKLFLEANLLHLHPIGLRLVDLQGRVVWAEQLNPAGPNLRMSLDMAGLPAGNYLLVLEQDGQTSFRMVHKARP